MPGNKRQILFTELWENIPPSSARIWGHPRGREVLELLCSALWHLELAAGIGGGFSTLAMKDIPGGVDPPWQDWLNQTPTLSVQTTEHLLDLHYSFPAPLNLRLKNLLQTMLLANATLRLAGARDILVRETTGKCPHVLKDDCRDDYTSILQPDGDLSSGCCNSYKQRIFKNVLLIMALRDSFMHGEKPTGGAKRRKFREKWIEGKLNQNRPKYSSFEIAKACRGVWEKLLPCVNRLPK